jgi:hypothetical protein
MSGPVKYRNRKTGVVYEALGEVMLNKIAMTRLKDGSYLVILRAPSGRILARPKEEFKGGRFVRLKPNDGNEP